MKVISDGDKRKVKVLEFEHKGLDIKFKSLAVRNDCYVNDFFPDLKIHFEDTMEINFLIAMLEQFRDKCIDTTKWGSLN